ncbi:NAD(P)H-dependent flavin oxidoreductase [Deinococcus arenicola]|uniref:Propionate 3-nitronate monooxygenase n=1 Tax=Deinococcus arenicola TaxID=2994950 RepID=A0ABU4DQ83_9DEIO|nr:nitronate monooxygenase [Deinococcus sp. ZS9-10]MDV6373864.1 nitronate monooxygenase [Deinococcus sp. ZS9-10]
MLPLTQRLGLRVPIVLAPMAGGVSTPDLVAAVSNAGGLGSVGAGYLKPEQIREAGPAVRRLTPGPFALNLFAPQSAVEPTQAALQRAVSELSPFHTALNLPPPTLPQHVSEDFEAQLEAVLEVGPAVLSFAFGRLNPGHLEALHARRILTIGTATGLEEARQLEADGVDTIVMQGGAAGGHRGGWLADELADTLALTRAAAQTIRVPLIAAGGLMTAADVRAVLDAGASLAQCGTAFLRAVEAGTSAPYREALAKAKAGDTVLTRAFSGRTARGLKNAAIAEIGQPLPYPFQNALTRQMRAAGAATNRADVLSLWAGEGVAQGREGTAAQILESLWS